MRLVFAGTPAVALPALDAIHASGHELLAVVTRPDAPAGRGRQLARSPVGAWADAHGVPVLTPDRPREPAFQATLRDLAPDCVPVVAYGALVPPDALAIPAHGWVNLHFSLLPAWRGAAPVQHAILHGDELTGASVFALEAGLDTGPVYGTLTEPIRPADTAGALLDRLGTAGAGLLVAVLDAIATGEAQAVPQPEDGVSLAPKLTVEDARVRWSDPGFAVDRRIRACTPAPGAWTGIRGDRLKVGPVTLIANGPELAPGEVLVERGRVLAGTGTMPVVLGYIQPAGRKPMAAADWARGARVSSGERLDAGAAPAGTPPAGARKPASDHRDPP